MHIVVKTSHYLSVNTNSTVVNGQVYLNSVLPSQKCLSYVQCEHLFNREERQMLQRGRPRQHNVGFVLSFSHYTTCLQDQQINLVNGTLIICTPRESTYYFLGLRSTMIGLSSLLFQDTFSHYSARESQGETVHSSPSQTSDSGCNKSKVVSVQGITLGRSGKLPRVKLHNYWPTAQHSCQASWPQNSSESLHTFMREPTHLPGPQVL